MSDASLRQSMAAAGVKNVQRFGIAQIAKQWKALFEDVKGNDNENT